VQSDILGEVCPRPSSNDLAEELVRGRNVERVQTAAGKRTYRLRAYRTLGSSSEVNQLQLYSKGV
jgi:uncharacterized protein (DUF39 family)